MSKKISWIEIPQKGLNGHVLLLGSIGSGKTVSMLLPLIEQALTTFNPTPSLLAIDTKATFISDLFKVVKKLRLQENVLHIRLGGPITLNPVYTQSPLKNGSFIEIAQSFRSASINFQGKKSESPFWDNSSFNLIKFSIAYCGAIYDYFTLKEVYQTLILASSNEGVEEIIQNLEDSLFNTDKFDEEELGNISFTLDYFKNEYCTLEEKLKSGIMATSTVFMNMFREYQASKLFCPPKEELVITSFDEILKEGKIVIFDVQKEGLSRAMGTFVKNMHLDAILRRGKKEGQTNEVNDEDQKFRAAIVANDEYQDTVTAGVAGSISDTRALAQGRSKKLIFIAATQAYSSLYNAIGDVKATDEIIQNFKTTITGQTRDTAVINNFQRVVGKEEIKIMGHSISEGSRRTKINYLLGGLDSDNADITESYSENKTRDYKIEAKQFWELKTFEAMGFVFDGIRTRFYEKIFLKPFFLKKKNTPHKDVLALLKKTLACFLVLICLDIGKSSYALPFPNLCTIVKEIEFESCLGLKRSSCTCGKFPFPRPCKRLTYYVPQSFIEVHKDSGKSYFKTLPGVALQLSTAKKDALPYGGNNDHGSFSSHAHSLAVPLGILFNSLPCRGARPEKTCLDSMSEHLGMSWKTGKPDLWQPALKAWGQAPAACLAKGAAMSTTGGGEFVHGNEGGCSIPLDWLPKYPPSTHSVCNGWGLHFPRTGVVDSSGETAGALMIASRIKSLASEVFRTSPSHPDEIWQMHEPASSSCFREGQNMSILEFPRRVNESGRLLSLKQTGHLFSVWKRVSCCVDIPIAATFKALLSVMKATCSGLK